METAAQRLVKASHLPANPARAPAPATAWKRNRIRARAAILAIACLAAFGLSHRTFANAIYTAGSSVLTPASNKTEITDIVSREITTRFRLLSPSQLEITTSFSYAATPIDGVITGVYLFDGENLFDSIASISTSDPNQFVFHPRATPPHLPGAKQYGDLSYEAARTSTGLRPGVSANTLTVTINLHNPITDDRLFSFLITGKLGTGYIVRSIDYGERNDSFVSSYAYDAAPNNEDFAPEPSSIFLFAAGFGILILIHRMYART